MVVRSSRGAKLRAAGHHSGRSSAPGTSVPRRVMTLSQPRIRRSRWRQVVGSRSGMPRAGERIHHVRNAFVPRGGVSPRRTASGCARARAFEREHRPRARPIGGSLPGSTPATLLRRSVRRSAMTDTVRLGRFAGIPIGLNRSWVIVAGTTRLRRRAHDPRGLRAAIQPPRGPEATTATRSASAEPPRRSAW